MKRAPVAVVENSKMSFGTDVPATLTNMHKTAVERCNFDQNEAKQKMREYLAYDGRFRDYDHEALINRVAECRSNGAILDFDDPRLKGQEPRPLERSRW
jgi:hypothetical protein